NSMQLIKETFKCKELPLSITYRCPKKVVEYAQMYNSEIQAAPTAVDGEVLRVDGMWKTEDFEKQHLVLCRVTRPIISLAYKLLNQKIPVTVLGRDIGVGLKALIKKCNPNDDISLLVQNLEIYRNKECTKLMDEGKESRVAAI